MAYVDLKKKKTKVENLKITKDHNLNLISTDDKILEKHNATKKAKNISDLLDIIFPKKLDSVIQSQPEKRRLIADWVECYTKGTEPKLLSYRTPEDLVKDIYPPNIWNEEDGYRIGMRRIIVEWIENMKTKNTRL